MTAYILQKMTNAPIALTLFEATDRLGGKIHTARFDGWPAQYEAGAAEIYDYSPVGDDPLKELIAELGLPISPIGGSSLILGQQILSNLDDVRTHLGKEASDALLSFDRAAKDSVTPFEYYTCEHKLAAPHGTSRFDALLSTIRPTTMRHYIEALIHSDLATEPERTNVEYGLHNYLMNDPRYMTLYRIDGGNERLPRELARRISANVRLNHVVKEIGRGEDGRLAVVSLHHGSLRRDSFDFVIIALPHNHLSQLQFRGERLATAMAAHDAHYNHPAHYLRMTVLFERPFWRAKLDDSFFMLDRFGGCCLYDEGVREPGMKFGVLGWLLGGQPALEMSHLDDATLIDAALDSLPDFLAEGRQCFLQGQVHRWPYTVNAIPGGVSMRPRSLQHQPEPVEHPDLFIVGDYLFDSTLNGVLDSAEFVAKWLASRLITM